MAAGIAAVVLLNANPFGDHVQFDLGVRDTADRAKMDCETTPKTGVILTLGQSNAANFGETPYAPKHDVVNFNLHDGSCYRARDPLLGTSGIGGNVATLLANMLIERRSFDRIIVVPIAIAGSTIEQWADGGRFNQRIVTAIRRLFDAGLRPTYVLWHQGENNSGEGNADGGEYRKHLLEVVSTFRDNGAEAPFFVALATRCGNYPRPGSDAIREGQRLAVNPLMHIFQGPDTDQLGDEYRDALRCHFNAAGMQRHAAMWAHVLDDR
jgi:hypothetical protein